tara:strand:+ start:299687 stop:299821 length:135 start_codon:yes stop_codon:yes gene_type:complete
MQTMCGIKMGFSGNEDQNIGFKVVLPSNRKKSNTVPKKKRVSVP